MWDWIQVNIIEMKYNPIKFVNNSLPTIQISAGCLPETNNPRAVRDFVTTQFNRTKNITVKSRCIIRQWITNSLPTIKQCLHDKKFTYSLILLMSNLKYYRSELFDSMIERMQSQKISNYYTFYLMQLYCYSANIKSPRSKQVLQMIKGHVTTNIKFDFNLIKLMSMMAIDNNNSLSDKNEFVGAVNQQIEKKQNSLQNFKVIKSDVDNPSNLSALFEKIKVYHLDVHPALYTILQKQHSLIDNQPKQTIPVKGKQNNHLSVFEIIFSRKLSQLGYRFRSNFLIKNNQYDFIVFGTKKSKNLPLYGFDLEEDTSKRPSISLEKAKIIANSNQMQWIKNNQDFEKPVVLELNGPLHYIDSDVLSKENEMTRNQQFKYEKLSLYGIEKYNLIQYREWEQINKFDKKAQKYIRDKIVNALNTGPCRQ